MVLKKIKTIKIFKTFKTIKTIKTIKMVADNSANSYGRNNSVIPDIVMVLWSYCLNTPKIIELPTGFSD